MPSATSDVDDVPAGSERGKNQPRRRAGLQQQQHRPSSEEPKCATTTTTVTITIVAIGEKSGKQTFSEWAKRPGSPSTQDHVSRVGSSTIRILAPIRNLHSSHVSTDGWIPSSFDPEARLRLLFTLSARRRRLIVQIASGAATVTSKSASVDASASESTRGAAERGAHASVERSLAAVFVWKRGHV